MCFTFLSDLRSYNPFFHRKRVFGSILTTQMNNENETFCSIYYILFHFNVKRRLLEIIIGKQWHKITSTTDSILCEIDE